MCECGHWKPMTCASHSAGRGRHRRPSVSRRGARRRTDPARPARAPRHRLPRAALQRIVLQGHHRCGAERDRARPHAVVAGLHRHDARRRHRRGAQSDAPVEARSRGRLRRISDGAAVVGGQLFGVPGIIHEANAVLGRANRFLSSRVSAIATSLPGVLDRDPALSAKTTTVGTPMRPAILAAAAVKFVSPEAGRAVAVAGGGRQPGRARDGRYRAVSHRAPGAGAVEPTGPDPAGARRRHGAGARGL